MNNVAVLIVTYNSSEEIGRCLSSVFEQRDHISLQVIVVDNASTDGTADLIRRDFSDVILLEPGRNLGFAAGVNWAARHAEAEFLLFLNPDTEILDHGIDRIVDFAARNPQYGVYGGRRLKPDGSLEPSSCWGRPTLWSMALFATGLSTLAPRNRWLDPESLGGWKRDTVREVAVITGCFLLVPLAIWRTLGGLDERYFMYGEDVDFALRARAAGHRPVICPDATLVHEVGQSSSSPTQKMLLLFRGKAELARSHWTGISQAVALALLQIGVGLRAILARARRLIDRREGSSDRWMELWRRREEWITGYDSGNATKASDSLQPAAPGT